MQENIFRLMVIKYCRALVRRPNMIYLYRHILNIVEYELFKASLEFNKCHKVNTAKQLGITRNTLNTKIKYHKIKYHKINGGIKHHDNKTRINISTYGTYR